MYSPGLAVMSLQYWVALQAGSCNQPNVIFFLSNTSVFHYRETEIFNLDDGVRPVHGEVILGVQIVVAVGTDAANVVPRLYLPVITISLPRSVGNLTFKHAFGDLGSFLTILRKEMDMYIICFIYLFRCPPCIGLTGSG